MEISNLFVTGFILNNLYPIFSTILVFICNKFPVYTFDSISDPINSEDLLNQIKKDKSFITGYSFKQGEKNPEGLFYNFSKRYIGYIKNYTSNNHYSNSIQYNIIFYGNVPIKIKSINNSNPISEKEDKIKLYLGDSSYNGGFNELKIPFNFTPYENQKKVINMIDEIYKENKFNICRVLVWGSPGGGKSFIGKLLAKKYNSHCCFDINLLDPGTPILNLWQKVMPSKENPLIIQIDELDVIITKIHNKVTRGPHDWLKCLVNDKQTFNTFLSEYLLCLPYVIYLFTMNSSPQEVSKLDTSYIRENRMDLIHNLDIEKKNN